MAICFNAVAHTKWRSPSTRREHPVRSDVTCAQTDFLLQSESRSDVNAGEAVDSGKRLCHRPWMGLTVSGASREVWPCSWGRVSCGNLGEQTAEQIWDGPGFRFYREKMVS